jgi:hypothetical protein
MPVDSASTSARTASLDDRPKAVPADKVPHVPAHDADDQRAFPLSFRIESGGPSKAKEYRVDLTHPYQVVRQGALGREQMGTCTIEGTAGSYVVLPNFHIESDPANSFFWAVWETDEAGVASLEHVLLTVEAFSAS